MANQQGVGDVAACHGVASRDVGHGLDQRNAAAPRQGGGLHNPGGIPVPRQPVVVEGIALLGQNVRFGYNIEVSKSF